MKTNKTNRKTIVLSVVMATLLAIPTLMTAQNDREGSLFGSQTIKQNSTGLMNQQGDRGTFSLETTTQQFGESAPLGSGLLIMMAAGAGYAVARRKRNKKGMALLLAFVMLLGFTQCKKNDELTASINNGNWIHFEMRVNDNAKHSVNPGLGTYSFADGDVIYVGNGTECTGYLIYNEDDAVFGGFIETPSDGQTLHIYYPGFSSLVNFDPNNMVGSKYYGDYSFGNQSSSLPILSYGTITYIDGVTAYTCDLMNQCALVKFESTINMSVNCDMGETGDFTTAVKMNFNLTDSSPFTRASAAGIFKPYYDEENYPKALWAIMLPEDSGNSNYIYDEETFDEFEFYIGEIKANDYIIIQIQPL